VGALLGAIPGMVVASLVGIVGPVVNIERHGPIHAVRRSLGLTWPHAGLTICVVGPLLLAETVAHAVLLRGWDTLGILGELPGYVWKPGPDGKPVPDEPLKLNDHSCDTMRYVIAEEDLKSKVRARFI
jgi:hypothetical protein